MKQETRAILDKLLTCEPGKGLPIPKRMWKLAEPLLAADLVEWMGFGQVRIYIATDKARAGTAAP